MVVDLFGLKNIGKHLVRRHRRLRRRQRSPTTSSNLGENRDTKHSIHTLPTIRMTLYV